MTAATLTIVPCSAADVVDLVGQFIVANSLRPGERLPPIRELAVRFGVKTGTVRDALLDAQGKGLVKVLPRVGAIVQSPGDAQPQAVAKHMSKNLRELMAAQDQNLFHVLDMREVLELSTIARASRRRELPDLFRLRQILEEMAAIPVTEQAPETEYVDLDIQFHLEIGRLSGNTVMTSMLRVLLEELIPHLGRIRWSAQRREETNASHARMYRTLVAGDVEAAQDEMRAHIRTAYSSLLEELREPPSMN
ncbi:MAG: FCD domain-containing protein [Pirellulales bacterium]